MGLFKKLKKAVSGAKNELDNHSKEVQCLQAINDVRSDVMGHDPRTWMKACAMETILKMGTPEDFKKCLIGKVKEFAKDISDPEAYVEGLWDKIKHKCPVCK